jgi:hypothetical protein
MRFEHRAVVDGGAEAVFALTQDYGRRTSWDPFLREARLLGGAEEAGVGVRAWCVSRSGIGMETEYVVYEPPRIAAVRMTRGPWLLASFGGAWELVPLDPYRTEVRFRYQLRVRPRWLSWLLEPLVRRWFSRETRLRVLALQKMLGVGAGAVAFHGARSRAP